MIKTLFQISLCGFIGVIAYAALTAPEQTIEEKRCGTENDAKTMAKIFIEKKVISPATLKFPWGFDQVKASRLPDCNWIVFGQFDSENEYGAMIRSNYIVKFSKKPNEDFWYKANISINP